MNTASQTPAISHTDASAIPKNYTDYYNNWWCIRKYAEEMKEG